MATTNPNPEERTAPTPADIRLMDHIGTDSHDMDHYLSRPRQTIYVLDGDRVEHTESVADRTVADWVAYVAAARGWEDCHFVSDLRTLFERAGVL